ncbi:ATP-binding protein [Streptomyces sp. N2-109]|uniref:ATP-binding protein n=1 Tax=Streptomyces gossypii TaxID=2883101 RepID=A0ABT2JWX0_9ACTN|nr:ATP-binding protein [Streptomyces gossypii]MCT2592226.1 ATP-binding protein [Streptomyces gossypii]
MTHEITLPRTPSPAPPFTVLLSPTRRGARLARLLTVAHLCCWGLPTEDAAYVVAELASNAASHGRVPGRNFRLSLAVTEVRGRAVLRIEVADTRGDTLPETALEPVPDEAESGRGLLLVEALADRWGVEVGPAPRKTVWAEITLLR